ncbi:MAG: Ribosome-recycling factor [Candidatus Roizmanbacteria bacterium GW2011_GWC2_37_13]|uniref:Ribosome-recycling factor n=1 Tax=Candidatus Roizmanbacteria bacterium GW2011_GWC2_37_13 TaxID=1618486 RepID=A0A0G0IIZ8_9BACT|nr:MAG: Ribosome-recycling factor [Candidatus Roizmanbacteria bacterium GW2011_GWC1_37_12]KKQ24159.1 MAG: Ribosome-recycling factor [Candidatus Roizmanbacteria bacterium GW2011_GWC2_37_13]
MDNISQFKASCQKVIESLKEDLKSIRTGRASPSLVENLTVETYGGSTRLKLMELSTIVTEGPIALSISPFDQSTIQDIERAILKSPLGLSPIVQSNRILLKIPPLSTEQREKFIKTAAELIEDKKNQIRNLRDNVRKSIKNSFEKKETTEDEKFRLEKEIDNISTLFTEEIQVIKDKKEAEIREV